MTCPHRILILGGTTEATALVRQLHSLSTVEVITSLAGRTQTPRALPGIVRVGGFGGVDGLVAYLCDRAIDILIDATHPFAAQISHHASTAATQVGIPHLILCRPPWPKQAQDHWIEVASHPEAAHRLVALGQRIFLTIGRQELAAFASVQQCWFLMRMIDFPSAEVQLPPGKVLLQRGPFTLAQECELLKTYAIQALVSKNSGGEATYAKIQAARELGLPVVMVQRPTLPTEAQVSHPTQAIQWIQAILSKMPSRAVYPNSVSPDHVG
ncbi:cobalt-precorrin-6A reductase [Synechococcales cyanobacterium C]|uniref:Cobalt-precorrin-6A reductase n=1 Tax=Petrachloros mirabilis ULC683 TaxID=2781853 RepID=A0A8K2AGW0_9CYAN|nr:cobalt-precorrin-6A reductase [Petrachloros mirabilis]NCJ05569.1 cobalt-precorrin-6A reductase [Petrachloros mirabilis ULC683]